MDQRTSIYSKPLRLGFKFLKIIFLIFLLLFISAIIYVSVNKKKIIAELTQKISEKINGDVKIGTVDLSFFSNFPKIAVKINDVQITDTLFKNHKHVFFDCKSVYATLSISKLIGKKLPVNGLEIHNGHVYLYTDSSGYTNKYLLENKDKKSSTNSTSSPNENELKSIKLDNIQVIINDEQKGKYHDIVIKDFDIKIKDETEAVTLNTKSNFQIKSLTFNTEKGSFLKDKSYKANVELHYNKSTQLLSFNESSVKIDDQPFLIQGKFDLKKNNPQFLLSIKTKKIDYEEVKSLLPAHIAKSISIVSLSGNLDIEANLDGPLNGGDPLVQIKFDVPKTDMKTPFLNFQKASFSGTFTNEVQPDLPRKDPNSAIVLRNFSAEWNELPMYANQIQIINLRTPELTADLKSEFPLKKLNDFIGSRSIELQSGTGKINLVYKGPIKKDSLSNSYVQGDISFSNGQILYKLRNVELKNVQGQLLFKNADMFIQNIQTNVLGNSIVMNGSAKNLLNLIKTSPGKVTIDYSIYSPSLNLGAFKFLLKNNVNKSKQISSSPKNNIAHNIDAVLEQANIHLNLKAGKLVYDKFLAENVLADITLLENKYLINKVSLQHANGNMLLSGTINNNSNATNSTNLDVSLSNMNVQKLFTAFNNFGQTGITAKSLEGNLSAKVIASFVLKDDAQILPSTINSTIDFSLKNGALNNYEPLKKIQNFIFKNRNFDHIQFAELKNRFVVKNQEVTINRMEIQSNVLSMFVEGLYSNRGNTDISIQVPLNNLKKRSDDYIPENIGVNSKTGKSIFLRGQPGADGNIKFKLDLFNRFNKQKNQSVQ